MVGGETYCGQKECGEVIDAYWGGLCGDIMGGRCEAVGAFVMASE